MAIVPASGGSLAAAEKRVRVQLRLADGTMLDGNYHGCPAIAAVTCSYSFFTAPRDRTATLIVAPLSPGREPASADFALGPFSYHGRDISYIRVYLSDGAAPRIGLPQRISPGTAAR